MKEKIIKAIFYGIVGFVLGFFLNIFIALPIMKTVEFFPYLIGEQKAVIQYCFNTRKDEMPLHILVHCNDIEMRTWWLSAAATVAIIFAIYGFFKEERKNW